MLVQTLASSVLPKPLFCGRRKNLYLSILSTRSKCAKRKKRVLVGSKRRSPEAENVSLLTQGKRLLLLQSLLKEPLTYFELHKQFGLSRQTLASLVRRASWRRFRKEWCRSQIRDHRCWQETAQNASGNREVRSTHKGNWPFSPLPANFPLILLMPSARIVSLVER